MAFDCAAGSDLGQIKFDFVGHLTVVLDSSGSTLVDLGSIEQSFPVPVIYNVVGGQAVLLPFQESASLSNISGSDTAIYEYSLPVVEPDSSMETVVLFGTGSESVERASGPEGLCWSTYYGGNRFDGVNESAKDDWDNYYVTGWTRSNIYSFPHGTGGPIVFNYGDYYATTSQFDSDEKLIWTTYLGAGHSTLIYSKALAIKEGSHSPIYFGGLVAGFNQNMFTTAPTGAYLDYSQSILPRSFICRLRMNGYMDWSTYWGNNTTLEGMTISVRRLVLTGGTRSVLPLPTNPAPYPATYLPPQPNIVDAGDAYVAAFDYFERTNWVTYIGGESGEGGYDVRCATNGDIYVYGATQSAHFYTHYRNGAYNQQTYGGGGYYFMDAFIARFSDDYEILWCSYFGGAESEEASKNGLAVSPQKDEVYIVGTVRNAQPAPSGFPLHPHANGLAYFDGTKDPGSNGYIAHFRGGSDELVWCTYFGDNTNFHSLETVTADKAGLIYVGGETASPNMLIMQSAYYPYYQAAIEPNDGVDNDGFIAMFKPFDDVMNWCTYFGGKAGILPEFLTTLVAKENALFAGGRTTKYSDLGSYFPLQYNGIPGSFYQDLFGDIVNPTADGFLSKFCTVSYFAPELSEVPPVLNRIEGISHWVHGGQLFIGPVEKNLQVQMLSCDGRTLWEGRTTRAENKVTLGIPISGLASGIYIVRIGNMETFKFFRP